MQSLLGLPNPKLVTTLIDGLLMQNQKVPETAFATVFASPYYWKELLSNLRYEKNLDKVPAALLTQKATAKAYVYYTLEGEYSDLTSFNYLDKRTYEDSEGKAQSLSIHLYRWKATKTLIWASSRSQ